MRDGHLLKRAGREFAKNLLWMAVVFGSLAAILVAATDLPLVGTMAFVGVCVAVLASLLTVGVLWSDAPDETPLGGGPDDRPGYPPRAVVVIGPVAAGTMVAEETVAVGVAKATFTPIHFHGRGGRGKRSC